MGETRLTGGCQCGAVRYALHAMPSDPCICYCRMCQKQFGNFFGALASVDMKDFELTRGELAFFRSSRDFERSFCRDCGTPLGYRSASPPHMGISIGSLDDRSSVKPARQYGVESREPWLGEILALPAVETGAGDGETPASLEAICQSNRQHPDHDTDQWPRLDNDAPLV